MMDVEHQVNIPEQVSQDYYDDTKIDFVSQAEARRSLLRAAEYMATNPQLFIQLSEILRRVIALFDKLVTSQLESEATLDASDDGSAGTVPGLDGMKNSSENVASLSDMLEESTTEMDDLQSDSSDDEDLQMAEASENPAKKFTCDTCKKSFTRKSVLMRHQAVHDDSRKLFKCDECDEEFKKKWSLKRHQKHVHSLEVQTVKDCLLCGATFSSVVKLEEHERTDHTADMPYVCVECQRRFTSELDLTRHQVAHEDERRCELCDKVFSSKRGRHNHMKVHTSERTHICDTCGRTFQSKYLLRLHAMSHTNERPHKCSTCGKGFRLPYKLREHELIHSGEKPSICQTCGKGFINTVCLNKHMKSHSGLKPHSCKLCQSRFTRRAQLKIHMMSHAGDRPHTCLMCGKSFPMPGQLNSHMLRHNEAYNKRFPCLVCSKSFRFDYQLKLHNRAHTGEKPYSCFLCGNSYTRQDLLNRHIKRNHQNQSDLLPQEITINTHS